MVRLYIFITLLLFGTGTLPAQTDGTRQIEILNSKTSPHEWSESLAKQVKRNLDAAIPNSQTHFIFNYSSDTRINPQASLLIFIGNEAWTNYLKADTSGTSAIPKIICSRVAGNKAALQQLNATQVLVGDNTEANLQLMETLIPSLQNIIYFSEQSVSDKIIIKSIDAYIEKNEPALNLAVIKSSNINLPYLQNTISNMAGENTAILLNNFNAAPGHIDPEQLTINRHIPIFLLNESVLIQNNHVIGGVYTGTAHYATAIAHIAGDILENNMPAGSIAPVNNLQAFCYLNQTAVSNFHFKTDGIQIPVVYAKNNQINYYLLYYSTILILLAVLFVLLVFLFIKIRKKKRTLHKKVNACDADIRNIKMLYNNIPVGMAIFDHNGDLSDQNPIAEKIFRQIVPYYTNNTFNLFESQIIKELSSKKEITRELFYNGVFAKNNGNDTHCQIALVPIVHDYKNAFFMIIEDDTKEYFDNLSKKKIRETFSHALDAANIGIGKFNLADNTGTASDLWYTNLGVEKNTPFAGCFTKLNPEDRNTLKALLKDSIQQKTGFFSTDVRVCSSGKVFQWYKISAYLKEYTPEAGNIIYYIIVSDIDHQKKNEISLNNDYQRLLNENQTNNTLIANMNHEIRTPLNAIIGFSELLIENYDTREQDELVKYINENNETLLNTINDIISMSKIETGQVSCSIRDINLNQFIQEIADRTALKVNPEKVNVIFNKGDNYILRSDEERLRQIINNFVSNAVKFTSQGSIELGFTNLSGTIRIYVKDTGCGIPDEKKNLIIQKFRNNGEGYISSGLGLPIAYFTAKLLKGEIGFESGVNQGSTFWCTIPNINMSNGEVIKNKLETATGYIGSNKKTILIAEDNENNYQLLNFILKQKYRIIHAVNGEEAVRLFKEENPLLILMDIKMPVMDGYQATALIREISKEIPIIAVTAFAFDEDKEKVLEHSFNEYISKPVAEKELMRVIELFIDKKE